MIAIARVSVNHDGKGGTAPDPLVWDQGSKPKVRKLGIRVTEDLASLPGPPGFLGFDWVQVHAGHITDDDMLLLGPIVLVFWLGSLPFWVPYIGHLALLT